MDYDLIKLTKSFSRMGFGITFVDEETIRRLNKSYRGIDKPTSILSFYQGQAGPEGTFLLGELIICPKLAAARHLNLGFLISHGLNNLLSEIPTAENFRTRRRRHPSRSG